jgi:nitroreductase
MNLVDAIEGRRSVRQYTDKPVERGALERLLQAAVRAPNAMNGQPWAFGIIEGKETLRQLSEKAKAVMLTMVGQFPQGDRYKSMLENPDYNIFYGAPALVVIYARPGRSPMPQVDCTLAAQNLMLAAWDAGLGSCWIGFGGPLLNSAEAKRDLGVPEDYEAVAPIIVGYPAGDGPASPRQAPEVVFWR